MLHTTFVWLKQTIAVLLFAITTFSFLSAQNLLNHVPNDADIVVEFNIDELAAKVDLDSLGRMPMMVEFLKGAPKLIKNPKNYGIETREKLAFFLGTGDNLMYFGLLVPINDVEKFKGFAQEMGDGWKVETTDNFWTMKDVREYGEGGLTKIKSLSGFTEKYALFIDGNFVKDPDLPDQFENYYERYDEIDRLKGIALEKKLSSVMGLNGTQSIKANPTFNRLSANKGEIRLFMNSEIAMGGMQEEFRRNPMLSTLYSQMEEFYYNNYLTASLSANDGAIEFDIDQEPNAKIREISESIIKKAKINKRFSKYVAQDDLLGYYSFAFNSYNAVKTYREMVTPIIDSIPNIPGGLASSGFDILDIFIDEDALADLIPGDMMVAFTGIKSYEREYTTYQYNDSTFEREEIIKTRKVPAPEFTFMMSTKNEEDMNKIMKALTKIPGSSRRNPDPIFVSQGSYLTSPMIAENTGMDLFVAMQDGIVFVSNNDDLIKNKLTTGGYLGNQRLAKAHRKAMKKNNAVLYTDMDKVLASIKGIDDRSIKGEQPQKILSMLGDKMDEMWLVGSSRKDPYASKMVVSMKDESQNAVWQIAQVVNDIYLETSKRRRNRIQEIEMVPDEEETDMEIEEDKGNE
ncbi:MAG: DUF4836 family protein [Bacteroidota bacterium]